MDNYHTTEFMYEKMTKMSSFLAPQKNLAHKGEISNHRNNKNEQLPS